MNEELVIESENDITSMVCGDRSNYEIIKKIGRGKYGEVFEAFNITNNRRCAIKVLKAIKHEKIEREIKILTSVSGGPNIIKLRDVLCGDEYLPALVFHFAAECTLKDVMKDLSEYEIKLYLLKLLRALEFTHNEGIIHRDVKPSNIMIDRNRKVLRLIDWGLAEFFSNQQTFSVCVASRYYKAPELLLCNKHYDYSVDMWGIGCILASILFGREPYFCGTDNHNQLTTIVRTLGSRHLRKYAEKHWSELADSSRQFVRGIKAIERVNWNSVAVADTFKHSNNDDAIQLIDGLLKYDQRFTASDTIKHCYFDALRHYCKKSTK